MGTLATETFPGASGAAWPVQWTTGTASTGVVNQDGSGHGVLTSGSASSYYYGDAAYLSGITAARDLDVTVDVTFPAVTEGYFVIQLRCPAPTATAGASNAYYVQMDPSRASGVSMDVGKVVSGVQTHLANFTVGPAWSAGTAQRIRFQAIGNTVQVKWWAPGSAEPGTWGYSTTDSSLSAATGSLAFQMVNGAAGGNRTALVSNVVLTNGSAAGSAALTGAGTMAPSAATPMITGGAVLSGAGTLTAVGPASPMRAWQNALTGRATATATALFVGVSLTEGQGSSTKAGRWVDQTLNQLRALYPTSGVPGGVGYLPSWYAVYGPNSTWQPYTSRSGTHANDTGFYGPGRRTDTMSAGAVTTYTITGDAADLCWIGGYGSFTWRVDGGSTTTVNTAGTTGLFNLTRISLGTAGSHTLTITATSTVHFAGVMVYNGDAAKGIRFVESGHVGFVSSDFAGMGNTWFQVQPDLVVINLGANDPGAGISAATMQANIQALIADLRAAVTKPMSVALLVYDWAAQPTYRAAYSAIVAADPTVALIDLQSTVTSLTSDGHPDDTGQGQVAAGVVPALSLTQVTSLSGIGGLTTSGAPGFSDTVSVAGSGALTATGIPGGSASSVLLAGAGVLTAVGQQATYTFTGPVFYDYRPFQIYPPTRLVAAIPYGESVWRDATTGAWSQQYAPSLDQLANADLVYAGGRVYTLTSDEVQALVAGGYGGYITPPPPNFVP